MKNLLDRVIEQFDTLIPFLAVSERDVYNLIRKKENNIFNDGYIFPHSYKVYQIQITHSAFLLGYSYFESFLFDIARDIYLKRPNMLPVKKQLDYKEILEKNNYKEILKSMVDRELVALFFEPIETIIDYFNTKFNVTLNEDNRNKLVEATYIRNCIVHNLNKTNEKLAKVSNYKVGQIIKLTSSDVHGYGIMAREIVRKVYSQAEKNHFNS